MTLKQAKFFPNDLKMADRLRVGDRAYRFFCDILEMHYSKYIFVYLLDTFLSEKYFCRVEVPYPQRLAKFWLN